MKNMFLKRQKWIKPAWVICYSNASTVQRASIEKPMLNITQT